MPIHCIDGQIPDDELHVWDVGPLDVCVEATCAQVRAAFRGPCLARGVALLELSPVQIAKLFPESIRAPDRPQAPPHGSARPR